jgi:hypothetical protein
MPTNPMNFLSMIINSNNPEQLVMNMLEQRIKTMNNPFMMNLYNLAKQGQTEELEKIARNMCKEQGKDFDKEFNSFRNNLRL